MRAAKPDALDLALISDESGMTVEDAFRLVSAEVVCQYIVIAAELAVLTAELS